MEKIYILGKLGGSDGFQVIDLESKTPAKGDDALFFDTFHKDGRKELFEIRRVKYKTYHTYIKYDLSAKRPGCILGFSFVYEENGNVIKDFLGLRQKMKAALNHLLEENGEIKIASFNDKKVIESLNHIEKFTKEEVKADRLSLPLNPVQYSPHNPKDLTNEQIWEMLKKSNYVEISEEIPTALSQKEQNIKTLTSQIQQLRILIQQKDTEIQELKNEKDGLIKRNEELTTQLKDANSKNGGRDREILNIKSCLSTNEEIPHPPHPQKESKLKEVLPFFILILVIINIVIGVSNCSGNSKQDETKHKDEIEELKNEISQYKDSCDLLNTQINSINNELNNTIKTYKEDTKPKHKKEEVKKEQKDTNKKQPLQDEKADYNEWIKNKKNREALTGILRAYAHDNNKKYDNINTDCKDCKNISEEEKIDLWKKYLKK